MTSNGLTAAASGTTYDSALAVEGVVSAFAGTAILVDSQAPLPLDGNLLHLLHGTSEVFRVSTAVNSVFLTCSESLYTLIGRDRLCVSPYPHPSPFQVMASGSTIASNAFVLTGPAAITGDSVLQSAGAAVRGLQCCIANTVFQGTSL
jgi:hypothetical protein